ncbi:hypothetical protein MKK63_31230 [Methylobacterium sp. J-088]|uniref:DUF6883 domain-containing protein n=1 Tax=unclassified Methylobacterium TaxID=2615210 RepID=UPI001FBB8931|nr:MULTISPECIES: DUF6883 domain-containing protein [unclassified Methylobacterium]MCJ2067131.1 hypothetical protein [Methylobacterium sp. J-088]
MLDPRKIDGYLLDETHIEGGSKARFFKRFGFGIGDPLILSTSLLAHPSEDTFVGKTVSARGDVKVIFEGPITTPDGRNPHVRTVWRIDARWNAHFVTAVPMTG